MGAYYVGSGDVSTGLGLRCSYSWRISC